MIRHLAGRVGQAIVATFGVLTIVFFIMRLSGDPTLLLVPEGATAQQIAELRHALGFDRPLVVQCAAYLSDLARLDLGQSLVQRAGVAGIVAERIPYTVMLATGALLVALGMAFRPVSSWRSGAAASWSARSQDSCSPGRACRLSGPVSC